MTLPALSLRDVSKSYWSQTKSVDRLLDMAMRVGGKRAGDRFDVLKNVSFDIPRGETVGIIGRNGAGKSTLLQIVAGTLQPTTGSVTVNGRVSAMIELGAGFNPEFTGRENIALAGALAGLSTKQVKRKFPDILEFAGIGDFVDQPVKTYSSGMYARLAFAVSAHTDADILIVDEILAVGDAAFQRKCAHFLERFREHGTVLFTSHSLGAVQAMCSRAIWIDHGAIREDGDAESVCAHYLAEMAAPSHDAPHIEGAPIPMPRRATAAHADTIEIFPFDPDAAWFGHGGGHIEALYFADESGSPLEHVAGGEPVELRIECSARRDISRVLVGFRVCDEMGQAVFGQNTHITYENTPFEMSAGSRFRARFQFVMPRLRAGLYSMTIALTEGTQQDNVHHHFITDAMFIRVSNSHVTRGVAGVMMKSVTVETAQPPS